MGLLAGLLGLFKLWLHAIGHELSWHLSSVIFSKQKESLSFSETNILAVGVRGCIIPFIGTFLFSTFNAFTVMVAASLLCLSGALVLIKYKAREKKVEI